MKIEKINQPILIVFEGMDGSGKTSISKKLANKLKFTWLRTPPEDFSSMREKIDQKYKDVGLALQLFYASTNVYISDVIKKKLEDGNSIILDRYVASTIAYDRIIRDSGLSDDFWIKKIFSNVIKPNITFYLVTNDEERKRRIKQRKKNYCDDFSIRESKNLNGRYIKAINQFSKKTLIKISNNDTEYKCVSLCLERLKTILFFDKNT